MRIDGFGFRIRNTYYQIELQNQDSAELLQRQFRIRVEVQVEKSWNYACLNVDIVTARMHLLTNKEQS